MLNEVRARHIRKLVVELITPGKTASEVIEFEIARREDTIRGLEAQKSRENDEIAVLKYLDPRELDREAGGQ